MYNTCLHLQKRSYLPLSGCQHTFYDHYIHGAYAGYLEDAVNQLLMGINELLSMAINNNESFTWVSPFVPSHLLDIQCWSKVSHSLCYDFSVTPLQMGG